MLRHTTTPFALFMFLLVSLVPLGESAHAAGEPDFDALRRQALENGNHWQVDETFSRSLTPERRANLLGFAPPPGYQATLEQHLKIYPMDKSLPASLNWRDLGGITPVKNQAQCGSCWAFAATAEMEAFVKIYYGVELDLAEQQVISCNPYGAGCGGGSASAAYYVFRQQGGVLENCHPYLQADPPAAPCEQVGLKKYAWVDGFDYISNDINQIKTALQNGPVCTGIDGGPDFEAYGSGCFDLPGTMVNHLVLIVGYDDRSCGGNGAWLIKNSWGPGFGEGGYAWVQYGAAQTGHGVTQLQYTVPPVTITLDSDLGADGLYGDQWTDVNWTTYGAAAPTVDIWLGVDGSCHDILVAENVPNTGTYAWQVPNMGTDYASLVVFPSGDTTQGYGLSAEPMQIIGHKTRYVSVLGSDTPPYETIATAAHQISDAVVVCTGTDTVLVAGGDYFGNVTLNSTVRVIGSWNESFTVQDIVAHPSRLQGSGSAVRVYAGSGEFGLLDGFVVHDCYGGNTSEPVNGQHGGAVYCSGASPTFQNCIFTGNRAAAGTGIGYGGAVCVIDGAPVFRDCEFTDNVASSGGAVGVFGTATASFIDCSFMRNVLSDSMESNIGGALFVEDGSVSMNGGSLVNNGAAGRGGAVYVLGGQVQLDQVALSNNRARNGGGAVTTNGGSLTLQGVLLSGNSTLAGNGGALDISGTSVDLSNVRITGNTAPNIGGGVSAFSATGKVENCQFDANSGGSAGGLFFVGDGVSILRNNMVFDNVGGGLLASGADVVEDWNNVWRNVGGDNMTAVPGVHSCSLDPMFVDAAAGDFGLGQYSPNVDGGESDAGYLDPDGSVADIGLKGGPLADFVAPDRVNGAVLTDLGGGNYQLTWNVASGSGIDHYVVYRDSSAIFRPTPLKAMSLVAHPDHSFDDTPPAGEWYYLVAAVDINGYSSGYSDRVYVTGGGLSAAGDGDLPQSMAISGIAPNPFNPTTTIFYDLPTDGQVQLGVYDVRGRHVRDLAGGRVTAGRHQVVWDGRDHTGRMSAAGVYFVLLKGPQGTVTSKMVLAK